MCLSHVFLFWLVSVECDRSSEFEDPSWRVFLTRVEADTDLDLDVGHVPHLEGPYAVQDVQGHVAHLCSVAVPIAVGNSGGHHVGVSYSLHLHTHTNEHTHG